MYNKEWYNNLNKSSLTPPGWVFSIAWSILYTLMIISFYLVWKDSKCYPYCDALNFFLLQLVLNLFWPTVFFRYKRIKLGFILLILIFIFSCITFNKFFNINTISGYLLIPYLIWLLFAMYLNIYIIYKSAPGWGRT